MDVLDNLKETWKNQPEDTKKVSKVEIYKLMHKKSISIVKWIFIIGILEFVFCTVFNLFMRFNTKYNKIYESSKTENITTITDFIYYAVMVYFLYKFYQNYKSISTSENTNKLMSKILKTRRTVRNYIITIFTVSFLSITYYLFTDEFYTEITNHQETSFYVTIIIFAIVFFIIIILIFLLFYQLLYGILLRKLRSNYKELAKLNES